jgi:hypothetical protein
LFAFCGRQRRALVDHDDVALPVEMQLSEDVLCFDKIRIYTYAKPGNWSRVDIVAIDRERRGGTNEGPSPVSRRPFDCFAVSRRRLPRMFDVFAVRCRS